MAYALVYWIQDKQYSVVCARNIHGNVKEGETTMVDWEESRKGRKAAKFTAYPAKIIIIGDNEEELELECVKVAEEMESEVTAKKRPRKKSRIVLESEEGNDGHQNQNKIVKKTNNAPRQQKPVSKKEELKNKKNAEIEAGKTQAAIFFKERYTDQATEVDVTTHQPSTAETPGPPPNTHAPPSYTHAPPPNTHAPPSNTHALPSNTHAPPSYTHAPPPNTHAPPSNTHGLPYYTPVRPSNTVTEEISLGETGHFLRSLYDLDAEDISTSEIEVEPVVERVVPCSNCSEMVNELKEEIAALKRRQLPFPISSENIEFLENILNAYKGGDVANQYQTSYVGCNESASSQTNINAEKNLKPAESNQECSSIPGPGKQELVPGSGVYISSARLHSIHSQSGKDARKLFLLLIETFFSDETLATSLAHGTRKLTSKDGSVMTTLNQDIVKTVKAYSGRFASINNTELTVSKMNRILTNKVGTAKRKKLKEVSKF